jgi:hypothetical protein
MDTKLDPMTRALLAGCMITGLLASSCGTPKYCEQGAFPRFLEEDWRTYCESYLDRVEGPGNYEIDELARFFGQHSAKSKAIRDELLRYEEPKACFPGARGELEYRRLDACAKDDDGQRQEIANAFMARLAPWIEDQKLRQNSLAPAIGDAEREATRIEKKITEAHEFHAEMDPSDFLKFTDALNAIEGEYRRGATLADDWSRIKDLASKSETILTAMDNTYGADVTELNGQFKELGMRVAELKERQLYMEYAVYSVGKPCPDGARASSELRTAQKVLKGKIAEVAGTKPRVLAPSQVEEREGFEYESFEGFLCGVRPADAQFEGRPRQCGLYTYKLERQRPSGERRWGDWALSSFEQSGPREGVECHLMK